MNTRAVLSLFLSVTAVLAALVASMVQCNNHARAQDLATRQREWEMLSAANAQLRAAVSAHVWGVPNEELDVLARKPARISSGDAQ